MAQEFKVDIVQVHIGGSNRKLDRQFKAFAEAGIALQDLGGTGVGHWTNRDAIMPDTPKARELLHKMGGSVSKKQWFRDHQQPHMF